jgi:site-specific DNA-cytosine methylase
VDEQKCEVVKVNVLSLFDGMSCGQIALERNGIKVDKYYASEIKKHAIKVTQFNYPNTIQLGDVNGIDVKKLPKIDLLIGGSPCQNISPLRNISKKNKGIYDTKSKLFFSYYNILNTLKPKYFLLENVNGHKESINAISQWLGVEPIRINSSLVSFQKRERLYWTNIPNITILADKNISFQDCKETDFEICKQYKVKRTSSREGMWGNGINGKCPNVTYRDKLNCLTCKQDRWNNAGLVEFEDFCRYLTVKECEMAQTVPVGYTQCLTRAQAYDVLGDGWTVDVISHILSHIPNTQTKTA